MTDLQHYIRLLRPYQWVKNLLLFAPLFFSGNILDDAVLITGAAIGIFSLVSGLGYVLNDWLDRETDRFHPDKKRRPFPSGKITGKPATFYSGIVFIFIFIIVLLLDFPANFIYYLLAYASLTVSYSLFIKQVVILEIFIVAVGFVIRVLAGGAACSIPVSGWLFLTIFFIAMMISVAKRVTELKQLGKKTAVLHRKSQDGYSLNYLNSILWACGSITMVVYALYALEHGIVVMYSVVPATYGIFRFIYLTDLGRGSDPIKALFSDKQLLLTTFIFLMFLSMVIYG